MKKILILAAPLALLLCSTPARAWNCSDPLASRVDVGSTKPTGSAGDSDGQYYKGPDAKNPNDYYVCQVPTPSTPSTGTQNQTQSQNQTATSSSTSTSSTASTSGAKATGGTATANGGSVNNSGNNVGGSATLKNSGNSSNVNTNTANGGQGGAGGQGGTANSSANATGGAGGSASSSNNSTGSGNTTEVNSTYKEVHQVATALAPDVAVTAPCTKGFSAAAQSGFAGASFGASKVDKGCDDRETARYFATLLHNREAAALILCNTPAAKRAHLTTEQCLSSVPLPTPVVVETPSVPVPVQPNVIVPQITVNIPAPAPIIQQVAVAASVAPAAHYHRVLLGSCYLEVDGALTCSLSDFTGNVSLTTGRILIEGSLEVDCKVAHILTSGKEPIAASRLSIHALDSGRTAKLYFFVKD